MSDTTTAEKNMDWKACLTPLKSLLYWTMLAASTIGPGTVVTCARAGAEYQLHLIWPLIIASIFAYISLEGTARLTIVSGKSLGECLQLKYSNGRKIWNVGIFCWVVVMAVFSGKFLPHILSNTFAKLSIPTSASIIEKINMTPLTHKARGG